MKNRVRYRLKKEERDEIYELVEKVSALVNLSKIKEGLYKELYDEAHLEYEKNMALIDNWWNKIGKKYDLVNKEWIINWSECEIYYDE